MVPEVSGEAARRGGVVSCRALLLCGLDLPNPFVAVRCPLRVALY